MKYVPAWRDRAGNRLVVLAPNQVFEDFDAAHEHQLGSLVGHLGFGWTPAGIVEIDLDDGRGEIPHVPCDGPFGSAIAVISGPLFDRVALDGRPE